MVRKKESKITSLVLTASILLLQCFDVPLGSVGLCEGSSISARLLYPFFHANIFHAALNCWCMLSVVFLFDVSVAGLLTAYAIAVSVPLGLFPCNTIPTVGLSGVCYALMGRVVFLVGARWKYNFYVLSYIAIGFLFPSLNGWLHLYCYIAGSFVGLLNKPLK